MRALLLVAHGSRRAASNEEVRALTRRLAARAGERFGHVACAFLELADPSIPEGIQACIDAGADQVIVLPYFLSAGRHVIEDIPAEVRVKQEEHPQVQIRIAPYLGAAGGIEALLLDAAGEE
ncbi:MAG: cobalamin biosynthesis protein CbiX [Gammaproteobacteria bacterium]|nr:MAG: cobalamin biosynthesis protein CbiX [Gammaproteobacteria bacterium]